MRKFLSVLAYIALSISALIVLVFATVELRTVIAGDYVLMNDPSKALAGYIFRFIYFLFILATIFWLFESKIKKVKTIPLLAVMGVMIAVCSVPLFFFYHYYIALVLLFVNIVIAGMSLSRLFVI